MLATWQLWALLSALFAALTAIFAKVGVKGINSDLATLIRTGVILVIAAAIVAATGAWQPVSSISSRTWLFLGLSGAATGLSWLCYFRAMQIGDAARVAPIDKLSVVLVAVFAVVFLREKLSGLNWLGVLMIGAGAVLVAIRA
jgi:transporter family protein